jgi:hypothetical protein
VNGFNNANFHVGEADSTISGGQFYSNDQYMTFDAYKNVVIEYVNVYADTAGPRYFELRSSSGSVLQQLTANLHPGLNTVNLHFFANAGNDYQLGWRAGSNPSLYRNIGGLSYPYVSPGLIFIKNSSAGNDRYYAFYDWVVHEPNVVCPAQSSSAGYGVPLACGEHQRIEQHIPRQCNTREHDRHAFGRYFQRKRE